MTSTTDAVGGQTAAGLPPHKLQRVLGVIEAHLAETMHVRSLADAVSLSPFHFARMFKKSTGQSPHAYITTRRMELAKGLLADSTLSLMEVGTRSGYQTQAHFTDVFRKHVGMTPGRYRRIRQEERPLETSLPAAAQVGLPPPVPAVNAAIGASPAAVPVR